MSRRAWSATGPVLWDERGYSAVWWGVALCLMGWGAAYFLSDLRVSDATQRFSQLEEAEEKAIHIADDSFARDISLWGSTPVTKSAYSALSAGFDAYIPEHLRDTYVLLNPFPSTERAMFEDARDGSAYTQAHAVHHAWFRQIVEERGYEDLFLLNRDGEVIYSTMKRAEFASQLDVREWNATGLSVVFRDVVARNRPDQVPTSDLGPDGAVSSPSARFAGTGIFGADGQLAGVLAVRRPPIPFSNLAAKRASALEEIGTERNQAFGIIFALSFVVSVFASVWNHAVRRETRLRTRLVHPLAAEGAFSVSPSPSPSPSLVFSEDPPSERVREGHQSGTRLVVPLANDGDHAEKAETG